MAITNSALPITLRMLEDWPGTMAAADLIPQADVLRAITEQQTAQLQFANLPDNADAYIIWMNDCDAVVGDTCDNNCDFTGSEPDSYRKAVEITQCSPSTFSIPIDAYRGNAFSEAQFTAMELVKHQKAHAEKVAEYVVLTLNTFLGEDTYADQGFWDVTDPNNAIHADLPTPSIFGRLARKANRKKMINPYLITGGHLAQMVWEARQNQGNGEGRGAANMIGTMQTYIDEINVDNANSPEYSSYLLARGAVALASKGYFPETVQNLGGNTQRFSIRNRYFPQLVHDVEIKESCRATNKWYRDYRIHTKYELFLNPLGCTSTNTGVLKVSQA